MARTTPAQKPRGEHSSTLSGGLRPAAGTSDAVMRTSDRASFPASTWPRAMVLSSEGPAALVRPPRPRSPHEAGAKRGADGGETRGHVAVGLRIDRIVRRCEQLVESLRRLDRVEPVALVDGGTLEDGPASAAAHQA